MATLEFLACRFTYHTRDEWRARIADGRITVNGCPADPALPLVAGDVLAYDASDIPEPPMDDRIALVHCDDELAVVNKSGNLTCHPCGRYFNHTLWALLKERHGFENPIFVNRIDRETSGLVVVARTHAAAKNLRAQFAGRTVEKRYLALVEGAFPAAFSAAGWIMADFTGEVLKKRKFVLVEGDASQSLGRAYRSAGAERSVENGPRTAAERRPCRESIFGNADLRPASPPHPEAQWAVTEFRLCSALGPISLVEAYPLTGRLHQIRVALQTLGFPLVGDKMYGLDAGVFLRFCRDARTPEDATRMRMKRQALHAAGLRFQHPRTGRDMIFDLPLPADMQAVIAECSSTNCSLLTDN